MIFKHLSFKYFFISVIIGLLYLYFNKPPTSEIIVYPTPDNASQTEYKDKASNCFHYVPVNVSCPSNEKSIKTIPIQV